MEALWFWYGLTRQEATTVCLQQGLTCSFAETCSPRQQAGPVKEKVICVKAEGSHRRFLLGNFLLGCEVCQVDNKDRSYAKESPGE